MNDSIIGQSEVIYRLLTRGYRATLAVRVAMTPPFTVNTTPGTIAELPRPGLEIAESIERSTPIVVRRLLGVWSQIEVTP